MSFPGTPAVKADLTFINRKNKLPGMILRLIRKKIITPRKAAPLRDRVDSPTVSNHQAKKPIKVFHVGYHPATDLILLNDPFLRMTGIPLGLTA